MRQPDAPDVSCFELRYRGLHRYAVYCGQCDGWYEHEPAEGHCRPDCKRIDCPVRDTGYNLFKIGELVSATQFCARFGCSRSTLKAVLGQDRGATLRHAGVSFVPMRDPWLLDCMSAVVAPAPPQDDPPPAG